MMELQLEKYSVQSERWPKEGRHILAQYTDEYVVVYQAYRPEIGLYAEKHQVFGGAYSFSRMSWIKPNFLWMMYRSGWACKEGQEVILAIYLKRAYFDSILASAWPSTNCLGLQQDEWKRGLTQSSVRLQWDPDHDPYGNAVDRRAVQLGLREDMLVPFKGEGILNIENVSDFVCEQRGLVEAHQLDQLIMPAECVYPVSEAVQKILCML